MSSATRKRKPIEFPVAQFVAVIVLSITIFIVVGFAQRAAAGYHVTKEEEKLAAQLAALEENNKALLKKREYVQTDVYIEEIARNELKWSKPGETVIVVLTPPNAQNSIVPPSDAPTVVRPADTPLNAWGQLFFSTPETQSD